MEFIVLPMLAVIALGFVFWVWALIDCIRREPDTGNDRIIWVLVILLLHFLGALVYVLARRPQRIRQFGA
ncbi:MAG: PLDc_N domain-containing protein [Xanthomonadales bacterium]|nr:PLDc_N domain-containing protein [Xanthomonadales bacterium]